MLGLDGLVPVLAERFLAEGALPNLKRLMERGVFSRIRPVIPAQTPTNWHTIATGASPGTHGVVHWGAHLPGDPVWEGHNQDAFTAGLCEAEYLWEAAARQGRKSVVMNYAGYPSTTKSAFFIDALYQPSRSLYDVAPPTVYHNVGEMESTDPVVLKAAEGWSNVPPSGVEPLETVIAVEPATEGKGPAFYALLVGRGETYDRLLLCSEKDGAEVVEEMRAGEWTEWIAERFDTEETGPVDAAFRFQLLELSEDASRFRLYRTDAFPVDGRHCSDRALGTELIEALGPYVHAGMTCHLHCRGGVEWDVVNELMSIEGEWWSRAAEKAMDATDASLLVLHWHLLDEVGHRFVQKLDPAGPAYVEAEAEEAWNTVRRYYWAADRFVGTFMERFDDEDTLFIVVSDHGMPVNKKAVSLINCFKEKGWIQLTEDGKGVDWTQSSLFFAQNHLWINLEGRDPGGIVPASEYRGLRQEILNTMRDLKDADTGEHAFAFVLPREDASMVGLWGDRIGDLVFCYEGGYRWSGPEVLRLGEERVIFPCEGGNHGPMIPTYETDITSVLGSFFMAGPSVTAVGAIPKEAGARISTKDVAPTVSYLLDMEPPAQTEGRVLREWLAGFESAKPERQRTSAARPIRKSPPVQRKPKPIQLQGDVTDSL